MTPDDVRAEAREIISSPAPESCRRVPLGACTLLLASFTRAEAVRRVESPMARKTGRELRGVEAGSYRLSMTQILFLSSPLFRKS